MQPIKLGLVGKGISHSLSPFIHNYWLRKYQLSGSYALCARDKINKEDLLASNFYGFNVTMPFKKEVVAYLEEKDNLVQKIGAVNTVRLNNGFFKGTNTDATGFKHLLQPYLPLRSALILGAGGAALSSLWALIESKVEDVRVVVRNENFTLKDSILNGNEVTRFMDGHVVPARHDGDSSLRGAQRRGNPGVLKLSGFNGTIYPWSKMDEAAKDCQIFVNATPCGMKGNFSPLALPALPTYCLVVDWVYHPYKTALLSEAEKRGHPTIDGLELLLAQAKDAFHFWFGIDPEITTELRQGLCKLLD